MIIYLAGGVTGNLIAEWKAYAELMKIYLAGTKGHSHIFSDQDNDNAMKIFLAGNDGYRQDRFKVKDIYILESYFYIVDQPWMFPLLKQFKGFMLDSGAYTFMAAEEGAGHDIDWDKYVEDYAAFVVQHDIELYFELDIDSLVGITEVERLRKNLEYLTGRPCIPVWHKNRGKEYWHKMIQEYDYVAIGGIVVGEITSKDYPMFTYMLNEARKENCKVHALGFTNLEGLRKYKFYSVDSTAWLSGNRFGAVYYFDGKTMQKIKVPEGKRVKTKETALHNFNEWVKFSKYAELNL